MNNGLGVHVTSLTRTPCGKKDTITVPYGHLAPVHKDTHIGHAVHEILARFVSDVVNPAIDSTVDDVYGETASAIRNQVRNKLNEDGLIMAMQLYTIECAKLENPANVKTGNAFYNWSSNSVGFSKYRGQDERTFSDEVLKRTSDEKLYSFLQQVATGSIPLQNSDHSFVVRNLSAIEKCVMKAILPLTDILRDVDPFTYLSPEHPLAHQFDQGKVCGTTDLLMVQVMSSRPKVQVFDWKTGSNPQEGHSAQLATYLYLANLELRREYVFTIDCDAMAFYLGDSITVPKKIEANFGPVFKMPNGDWVEVTMAPSGVNGVWKKAYYYKLMRNVNSRGADYGLVLRRDAGDVPATIMKDEIEKRLIGQRQILAEQKANVGYHCIYCEKRGYCDGE